MNLHLNFVSVPTVKEYLRQHAGSVHYYIQHLRAEGFCSCQLIEVEAHHQRAHHELEQNHHSKLCVYHGGESAISHNLFL